MKLCSASSVAGIDIPDLSTWVVQHTSTVNCNLRWFCHRKHNSIVLVSVQPSPLDSCACASSCFPLTQWDGVEDRIGCTVILLHVTCEGSMVLQKQQMQQYWFDSSPAKMKSSVNSFLLFACQCAFRWMTSVGASTTRSTDPASSLHVLRIIWVIGWVFTSFHK